MADTLNNRIVGLITSEASSIEDPLSLPASIGADIKVFMPDPSETVDTVNPIDVLTHAFDTANYSDLLINQILSEIDNTRMVDMSPAAVSFTISVVDLYLSQQKALNEYRNAIEQVTSESEFSSIQKPQEKKLHVPTLKSALIKSYNFLDTRLNKLADSIRTEVQLATEEEIARLAGLKNMYLALELAFNKLHSQVKVLVPGIAKIPAWRIDSEEA